jgi:hypothetical protein
VAFTSCRKRRGESLCRTFPGVEVEGLGSEVAGVADEKVEAGRMASWVVTVVFWEDLGRSSCEYRKY